ncbi:MAG TPA: hypothetical protein VFR37_10585 [Longimicrobium sp.]|nr:hypothetical protein [Longimicrobium sp.]
MPTVWNRLAARMQGEVSAATLEAYRRASLPVFDLMDRVERRRLECAGEGLDPWSVPPATRAAFLCAWNAFVLQTLGNDMVDADYGAEPATTGFVPPVTAHQVLAFYGQVEGWLSRGLQAVTNPDYRLDVHVPAELPPWESGPYPPAYVEGILRSLRSLADLAAAAMTFLPDTYPDDAERRAQLNRIRQRYVAAESKARYVADLQGTAPTRRVHERLEPYAQDAIELFFEVGQMIADPALTLGPPGGGRTVPGTADALPGQPGFDEWCLTDPDARLVLENNGKARRALRRMWEMDPNPARTMAIQAKIEAALLAGTVAYAENDGRRVGHFDCCPWGPVYVARRQVSIDGTTVPGAQHFVYAVGAPGGTEKFRRRILVGGFAPTTAVEYGPYRPGRQ